VPYTQAWFLGVAHLRGGLWAAIDLAPFIGDDSQAPAGATDPGLRRASPEVGEEARFVTFHAQLEVNGALRVDRLAGLRGPEDFPSSVAPQATVPAWFGTRYSDAQGQIWQSLSLAALARDPRFLSLAD
jgi:twitching motility protein PilI